ASRRVEDHAAAAARRRGADVQRPPHGDEPGPGRPEGAGRRHRQPRLRGQDLPRVLRRPGETAMTKEKGKGKKEKGEAGKAHAGWLIRAVLLFFSFFLFPFSFAEGALDTETGKPYRLQVVLYFHDHRLLTDVFKDQVERELRDGLRAAFGDLATVDVVRQHPKLEGIEEKGLGPILDAWKDVNDIKTHFILIDFAAGHYELMARQPDGYTGQASPMIRRERTPDRYFVARTAALLINRDLGLVGTVVDKGEGGHPVRLALKGAGLKVPLDRWVKKGDVFAISRVRQGSGGLKGDRVQWALLQMQEGPDAAGV